MDLDFDIFFLYCWGEFLKCSAGVHTFLFISKIHLNTEKRHRNLSPSKVVTFLYVGTCLWFLPHWVILLCTQFNYYYFSGYVTDVALPANGKYFVSAENDQKVIIWNLNSRVVIHKDIQINVDQLLIIEDFTPHLILGMKLLDRVSILDKKFLKIWKLAIYWSFFLL